ncbi:MAG: 2-hydroxychromene-2-carboxylate isomerase [Pseudomonadota bacterium]
MAQIDYYFTPLSPFTYLAGLQLEEIAARHGATIAYKPINFMRAMDEMGGLPVPKRHPSRQAYRLQELPRIAKRNNLPLTLNPAHWPTNPVPAMSAILAAVAKGSDVVGPFAHRLAAACWAEERDIADPAVVAEIAHDNGLAFTGLELAAAEARIEPLTDEAIARGVFGAPWYAVGDQDFWGQDRLAYLDDHLAGKI